MEIRREDGFATFAGALVGAALMYEFDPRNGRRRRALLRDKARSASTGFAKTARVTSRDLSNRARGTFLEAIHALRTEAVDDRVLEERVRARLGSLTTYPSTVTVFARNGCVRLSGVLCASEHEDVLVAARRVRGVRAVEDWLDLREEPDDGRERRRIGRRRSSFGSWAPATRLLLGAGGLSLVGLATLWRNLGSGRRWGMAGAS